MTFMDSTVKYQSKINKSRPRLVAMAAIRMKLYHAKSLTRLQAIKLLLPSAV